MRHLPLAAEHGRHDRWKDTAVTLCACMDNCGVGPYTQLSIHLYRADNENSMEASCFQKKGTEQTTKRGHKCKGSPCTRGWLFLLAPPPPAVRPRWGGRMLVVAWMSIWLGWGAGGAEGDDDRWGGRVHRRSIGDAGRGLGWCVVYGNGCTATTLCNNRSGQLWRCDDMRAYVHTHARPPRLRGCCCRDIRSTEVSEYSNRIDS